MSIANEIQRLQQAKSNIKTAIESKGVTVPSVTTLDGYPSIITSIQTFDPYNGHDYVEIGGLKWATMNIGASSVTDYGLYFQWGDTTGYASNSVGNYSVAYKKPFGWQDYKFGNGLYSPGASGMTKYNGSDNKIDLDMCDDAARANWGGKWRVPTTSEFQALGNAVNTAWTQVNGVSGMMCTDKTDVSKSLFFPAAGYCELGIFVPQTQGVLVSYWSGSLDASTPGYEDEACCIRLLSSAQSWFYFYLRREGMPIRAVVGE